MNTPTDHELEMLRAWTEEVNYLVACTEVGEEEERPHIHAKITFRQSKRLPALKKLCPRGHWDDRQTGDSLYAMKIADTTKLIINHRVKKTNQYQDIADDVSNGMTIVDLWKKYPGTMIRCHKGVYEMMARLKPRWFNVKYSMDMFKIAPVTDWDRSLVILGPRGTGKTQYAKALIPAALMASHTDDLKVYDKDLYDGIIFDDMDFKNWPRTSQIHLVDIDEDRSIHCRFTCAFIPAGTKKIFTCNEFPFVDDPAIQRRVRLLEISGKIYK